MIYSGGFYFPDKEVHFTDLGDDVAQYQEPQRLKAFEYVTNWTRALDLGAHVGIFSRHFATRFDEVVAFEPTPTTRACLERNVPDNVVVQPYACGDRAGEVTIRITRKNSGGSEIVARGETEPLGPAEVRVPMVTIDSFGFDEVGLMKLDIQFSETIALIGAEQTLRRCRPVVLIEEVPVGGKRGTADHIEEARDVLLSYGYEAREKVGADRIYVRP